MTDPGCIQIQEWQVSFYNNDTRSWMYGKLWVTPEFAEFIEKESDRKHPYIKTIKHNEVSEVKKSMTGLIFKAVVLTMSDKKTNYWISSLPDYTSIYNVLQYFQRQNLFMHKMTNTTARNLQSTGTTEMGRKLLKIVHDSESTLSNAANVLQEQGTQLLSSLATMHDIHNDLDIADSILSGLESWLGKWKIPSQYRRESLEIVQSKDLPTELDYEILYTKLEMGTMNCQHLGVLRVCTEGLIILTDKQKVVYNFKWSDLSVVKVVSLCEILVTRYLIGQPDLTFDLVCSDLLPVIRLLDKRLKSKVEYNLDIFKEDRPRTKKLKASAGKIKVELFSKIDEDSPNADLHPSVDNLSESNMTWTPQIQVQKQIVTNQEVEELCQTLQNIKSMAIASGQELDIQNDNIDKLTDSVNIANQRLAENDKRIRHLVR